MDFLTVIILFVENFMLHQQLQKAVLNEKRKDLIMYAKDVGTY